MPNTQANLSATIPIKCLGEEEPCAKMNPSASNSRPSTEASGSDWYRTCWRQIHLDMHLPEFPQEALSEFDPVKIADHLQRANVGLVAVCAKDHFGNAYYPTRIGHPHKRLHGDPLAKMTEACRERGIRTLAYYSMCWDGHAWEQHPEWRYDAPNAEAGVRAWGGYLCADSGYAQQLALPQLQEIVSDYDIDGIFIDTPYAGGTHGHCLCHACASRAQEEHHGNPASQTASALADRQRMNTCARWLRQLRDMTDRSARDLRICMNIGATPHANREIKQLLDIGVWESQPKVGDYLTHSFACRSARNDILGAQIMTVRFHKGWGDQTLKPVAQLKTEAAAIIGNGMPVCIGDQVDVDGTVCPVVYETLTEVFDFVKQRETIFQAARSCRQVGILYPSGSGELSLAAGVREQHAVDSTHGEDALRGAHKVMVESHIQAEMIYEAFATNLDDYKVIVLPGPSGYTSEMAQRLRSYIENGGVVIAAGRSVLDENASGLSDVFGVEFAESTPFPSVHFRVAPALCDALPAMPYQFRGPIVQTIRRSATELAAVHLPVGRSQEQLFRSQFAPPEKARSPYSFATVNHFGKGKAVYLAGALFGVYWANGHHWLRQLIEVIFQHVQPNVPYTTNAPATVEMNLMTCDAGLLLAAVQYGIGHQGTPTSLAAIERAIPVHHVACELRCTRPSHITLEPEGDPIDFEWANGRCTFTIPKIEYLAMVQLHGARQTP